MAITDFIFDGQALSDFGYMVVFENTENVVDVSVMDYDIVKAALSDESRRVSHKYESNYSSTFTIMKSLCDNPDESSLTKDDITELTKWLVRKQYKWFRFVDDDDDDEIWYKAQFQIKKEYIGENVISLQVTLNTNAPYGFTREIVNAFSNDDNQDFYEINIHTDEEGVIYPTCKIDIISDGNVELYSGNTANDLQFITQINNCVAGEIITIDGESLQITSNIDHDFTNDFNYVYPRFCSTYRNTKNYLWLQGSSGYEITLKYRGIRKVGLE